MPSGILPFMIDQKSESFESRYTNAQLIRDVWSFLRPYKGKVIVGTLFRGVSDIAWLYPAWVLATILTFCVSWKTGDSLALLWWLFAGWIVAMVVKVFGQFFARKYGFAAGARAALDAKNASMTQLFALDMAWHEQENTGNKLKRIDRGGDAIDRLMRTWINTVIEMAVVFVGTVVMIGITDRVVACITAVFLLSYIAINQKLIKKARIAAQKVNAKEEELHGVMFEGVNNIRTAKVLNMTTGLMARTRIVTADVFDRVQERIFRFQGQNVVLSAYSITFRAMTTMVIALSILDGAYAIGFLVIFNFYFGRVIECASNFSDTLQDLIVQKLAVARMQELLNIESFPDGREATRNFPKDWQTISVRNLSFTYGADEVLHDISFDLHRGERLGLVGLSGAGKSTLFKLLLKENEEYTGEILVDDVPLRSIKKSSYYQKATVVLQETEVFNFSLRENITIANPKKKDENALEKALNIAHVTSFLHRLPQGVDTTIGEKGVKLSGGERQRVGIARAVFKEPEILFLDEATSHLDVESEEKIQDSLHVFFKNVTALVIAHRLTTIKEMDRILVLESGNIIESGTFDELHARRGRFFELWEKQKLG